MFKTSCVKARHYYSDEWCKDSNARTQEQLQKIAKRISDNCTLAKIITNAGDNYDACTEYVNEALGLRYWIHDTFGHITAIDETRSY